MGAFGKFYDDYKNLHPALKIGFNSLAIGAEAGGASMMGLIPGITAFIPAASLHIREISNALSELTHK